MNDDSGLPALFGNLSSPTDYGPETVDMSDYQSRVASMIADARDYSEQILQPARELAERYYNGTEPAMGEEGRSSYVSNDVKDTIQGMLPSLMRIFTSTEPVVTFQATYEGGVTAAMQATDYVGLVFMQDNDGYRILYDAIFDALKKATGVITWYTDTRPQMTRKSFTGATKEQIQMLLQSQPGVKLISLDREPPTVINAPDLFSFEVEFLMSKPKQVVEACPSDEFRIDRAAKSVEKSHVIGRERYIPGHELVAMGYDPDQVEQYREAGGSASWSEERTMRNEGLGMEGGELDPEDGYVQYGEYFVLIDQDGDGIAELHEICVMGGSDAIVRDNKVEYRRIALLCPDFEPHTAIGHSISEYCYDIQRIKTNLMRSSLDSLANTIYPRMVVNEQTTNMDDVLNNELGAPIRTRANPSEAVSQLAVQFNGEQIAPMIQYLDTVRQQRSGVSEASKGVDPKALQSSTQQAVQMVIQGAQERIELVARNMAYTGLRDLFSGLLREITAHPNAGRIAQLRGKFQVINPSLFDPTMSVMVNPHLGKGSDADRMFMLTQVMQKQEQVIASQGLDNPMVSPIEYRNTLEDLLALGNIKDVSRYFKPLDVQTMAAFQQTQQQKAASQPNPAMVLANAEVEKNRADMVKAIADDRFRHAKLDSETKFKYDQLYVKLEETVAQLNAQFGMQLDHEKSMQVTQVSADLYNAEQDRIHASADASGGGEGSADQSSAG